MQTLRLTILAGSIILSASLSACDSTEKKREKTQEAIPSERFEEAKAPDSLSNNKVSGDNDGNDGTMNGSMPEHVAAPKASASKKDN